jgi:hypothetical protein
MDRVDGIIADEFSLSQILYQMGWGDEVETPDLPAAVNSVHLVFTKHTKQTHLLDRFNQALIKMKSSVTYSRILYKAMHGAKADGFNSKSGPACLQAPPHIGDGASHHPLAWAISPLEKLLGTPS